jgi:hypothetical protein
MTNDEEIREYERQRVEAERREDAIAEREFWITVYITLLEREMTVEQARGGADQALSYFRERFQ